LPCDFTSQNALNRKKCVIWVFEAYPCDNDYSMAMTNALSNRKFKQPLRKADQCFYMCVCVCVCVCVLEMFWQLSISKKIANLVKTQQSLKIEKIIKHRLLIIRILDEGLTQFKKQLNFT
jgi:hypothetical protein